MLSTVESPNLVDRAVTCMVANGRDRKPIAGRSIDACCGHTSSRWDSWVALRGVNFKVRFGFDPHITGILQLNSELQHPSIEYYSSLTKKQYVKHRCFLIAPSFLSQDFGA